MTELMVASAVGSVIMACLAVGAVTLQRGYSAAEHQTRSQLDQMRIVDYISRDLRRAVAVRVENSGPSIGTKLVIDVPDLSGRDSASGDLLEPALVNGDVRYGSAATTVAYYVEGIAFIRQEASAKTVIANKRIEEFKADRSSSRSSASN
jgi:type II secretory pathway component PulJ